MNISVAIRISASAGRGLAPSRDGARLRGRGEHDADQGAVEWSLCVGYGLLNDATHGMRIIATLKKIDYEIDSEIVITVYRCIMMYI